MRGYVFMLVLLTAVPAAADDWDDAAAAYESGRYEEAIRLMTPLAEAGVVQAQSTLAHVYSFGHGTPPDDAAAFDWMRQAAEQGDAGAQSKLGQMYLVGLGVEKNEAEAARWFGLAADQYEPTALYNLATLTMHGIGVEADPTTAIGLYYAAVSLDEPNSMLALSQVYMEGRYEPADIDMALQFLAWSAQLGNRRASAMLAVLMQEVPEIEHNLVKSAIHYQIAMARGCDDLGKPAARAVSRLSPQELALYQRSLPNPMPVAQPEPHDHRPGTEHCLSE
jgi:uncharacterized protein